MPGHPPDPPGHKPDPTTLLLMEMLEQMKLNNHLMRKLLRSVSEIEEDVDEIEGAIPPKKRLSSVKIAFTKGPQMPAVIGPITLQVGQSALASLVGFDQNGAQMPADFVMPASTFAGDNDAVATIDTGGKTTAVAAGVANVTGSVTSAEGLALSDSETVTVSAVVPVLSSVKVAFDSTGTAKP